MILYERPLYTLYENINYWLLFLDVNNMIVW